jgi:hypothetical protein
MDCAKGVHRWEDGDSFERLTCISNRQSFYHTSSKLIATEWKWGKAKGWLGQGEMEASRCKVSRRAARELDRVRSVQGKVVVAGRSSKCC